LSIIPLGQEWVISLSGYRPSRIGDSLYWPTEEDCVLVRIGIRPFDDGLPESDEKKLYPTRKPGEYKYTDFRWHDLRHTWASWHVQAGTPLHVLQELGGWASPEMVQRYAHLSAAHLEDYANNIGGPKPTGANLVAIGNGNKKRLPSNSITD